MPLYAGVRGRFQDDMHSDGPCAGRRQIGWATGWDRLYLYCRGGVCRAQSVPIESRHCDTMRAGNCRASGGRVEEVQGGKHFGWRLDEAIRWLLAQGQPVNVDDGVGRVLDFLFSDGN